MADCVVCGRYMVSQSRPVWLFRDDLSTVGQCHSGCWVGTVPPPGRGTDIRYAEEVARFWEFVSREPYPSGNAPEQDARQLAFADEPPGPIGPERERYVAHWRNGSRQMNGREAAEARAAYDALLARYRAVWPATGDGTLAEQAAR